MNGIENFLATVSLLPPNHSDEVTIQASESVQMADEKIAILRDDLLVLQKIQRKKGQAPLDSLTEQENAVVGKYFTANPLCPQKVSSVITQALQEHERWMELATSDRNLQCLFAMAGISD